MALSLGIALGHWKFPWSPVLSLEHVIICGFDIFLKVKSLQSKLGNILWPEVYKDMQGWAAGLSAQNTFIQLLVVALTWIQWSRGFLEISSKCDTLFNTLLLQQLCLLDVTKLRFSLQSHVWVYIQHLMSPFTVELLCFHMVVTISLTMPRLLLATSQLQNKVRELKSQGKLCQTTCFTLQPGWAERR